jgi:hypothetical protein
MVSPLGLLLVWLGLSMAVANVDADTYDERRIRQGARLFRVLLAADVGLEKKVAADGQLQVLVYGADVELATQIGELIAPPDAAPIRGLPLKIAHVDALPDKPSPAPVGLFLIEPPSGEDFDALVRWGIANHVIVYSPFEGDVERGALGGLSIEAKVLPYVNLNTLEATGVELKPFFLKVAKQYR